MHFHIIPKREEAEGLKVGWPSSKGDDDALKAFAEKVAANL